MEIVDVSLIKGGSSATWTTRVKIISNGAYFLYYRGEGRKKKRGQPQLQALQSLGEAHILTTSRAMHRPLTA